MCQWNIYLFNLEKENIITNLKEYGNRPAAYEYQYVIYCIYHSTVRVAPGST